MGRGRGGGGSSSGGGGGNNAPTKVVNLDNRKSWHYRFVVATDANKSLMAKKLTTPQLVKAANAWKKYDAWASAINGQTGPTREGKALSREMGLKRRSK